MSLLGWRRYSLVKRPHPGCGGTGLYVKCLTEGLDSDIMEDKSQRSVWERQSLEALQVEAEQRVPEGMRR